MTKIERIICGTVNCYLLTGENGAVLVDTGGAGYEEKVLKMCENKNVRLLVLTHGHIDHIQNAAYLAQRLGIPIAMDEKDRGLVQDQSAQDLTGAGVFGKVLAAVSKRKMRKERIEAFIPEISLNEGDTLEAFGVRASVLELPGHTEGSIGLDVDERAVIVGDALMHMLFPGIACIYGDERKLRESAGKITALSGRTVYFGHGAPTANRKWS